MNPTACPLPGLESSTAIAKGTLVKDVVSFGADLAALETGTQRGRRAPSPTFASCSGRWHSRGRSHPDSTAPSQTPHAGTLAHEERSRSLWRSSTADAGPEGKGAPGWHGQQSSPNRAGLSAGQQWAQPGLRAPKLASPGRGGEARNSASL